MESCDLAAELPSSPETPADITSSGSVRRNQATSRGKRQTQGSHPTPPPCVENTAISRQDEGWESPSDENNCSLAVAVQNEMTSPEASSVVEPANMIASSSVVLDIVCGINRAKLYVEGLRNGSKTASVLLTSDISEQLKAGMWVTPNQFQHASGRGTARDWKRSIKHHGTSLKALLSSRTLSVEPAQCRCPVCSGVVSASSAAAESDVIPLNLSTESTETESHVTPCGSRDDDELLEKPEEGEDRIQLKRQMMSALSLLDVNQATQPSYLWRLPEVVSSTASKRPASLDWDWNQLQYSGPNTERKRAKKEETTISHHHHHQQQVTRAVTSSAVATSAGTSLFDFVVMTSFTDAYNKFRSQRAPKQQHQDVQDSTDMKGASYDDVIESVVSKSRDECEQKSTTVTEKRLKTTDSQRIGSQHLSTNAKTAVIERNGTTSSSASVSTQESPRDAKKRSVQRHEVTSSVRANAVVTSSSAAAAIDAVSAVSNKQLPDLVQSALPTGTMTPSNVGLLPGTALLTTSISEMISYPVDSFGALDLSPSTTRQLMAAAVALMVQRQRAAIDLSKWSAWNSASLSQPDDQLTLDLRGWPAAVANTSDSEVLDLSCKPSDQQPRKPEKPSGVPTDVVKNPHRNQAKVKVVSATDASLPPASGHVTPASSHPDNDNPLSWGVRDVIEFVSEVPGCQIYAETFKRFGVRGSSLPVLTVDHMTDILRMDVEAAKSLRLAIERMMTSYASSDKPAKIPAVEASSATELALQLVDSKPNL